jgi:hypothetical protein
MSAPLNPSWVIARSNHLLHLKAIGLATSQSPQTAWDILL